MEEKATKAYGAYMEQLDTKAMLEGENTTLSAELDQMKQKIASELGDLGQYQERMAKASTQKADLEVQLEESRNKLQVQFRNLKVNQVGSEGTPIIKVRV